MFGLNAGVVSRDERKAVAVASRLQCGTVSVNETYQIPWASMGAGMGGMKDSGLGRRHGMEGMLKYTESQNVSAARISPILPLPYMSRDANQTVFVTGLRLLKRLPGLR